MNSLTTGAWGSFSAPCSRALGGKSRMTRAAPLVCFALLFSPRCTSQFPAARPYLFVLLLLIFLMPWSVWVASLPPTRLPPLLAFIQEQTCRGYLQDQSAWLNNRGVTCPSAYAARRDGARAQPSGDVPVTRHINRIQSGLYRSIKGKPNEHERPKAT